MGADVVTRHVVEIPADKQPFHGGLAGLAAFTITGWINVRDAAMGAGGDRVLNYCSGGGGIVSTCVLFFPISLLFLL